MSAPSVRVPVLLGVALVLGALGNALLREVPWGVNMTVMVTAAALALLAMAPERTLPRVGLAAAAVAIAFGFAWRDSPILKGIDLLAALTVLGLLASHRGHRASLSGDALDVARSAAYVVPGPLPALSELRWSNLKSPFPSAAVVSVLRGLVLAVPIVTVFAVLLANADAVFAERLGALVNVDLVEAAGHAFGTFILSWLAAGGLWAARGSAAGGARPVRPAWLALGSIEIGLVLGLLDLLFAGFVWVQMRYLFGGDAWVQAIAGLTYSEYARRGFFELVAVTVLALPLLLLAHWLLGHARPLVRRVVLGLAAVQVLLVLVMLASAFERMRLYREQYGQTEERFYTTAFMLWLAVLLVSFLLTVLPGYRSAFARVAFASALGAIAILHALNPDALIVRTNLATPRPFDVDHALRLSGDAAPDLVAAAPTLPEAARNAIAARLASRWSGPEPELRSWSLGRERARRAIAATGWPQPQTPQEQR